MNPLLKQKCVMCRGMRKPLGLKVRRYAACLIELNEYLDLFPGVNKSRKFFVTELNEIVLNRMTNN